MFECKYELREALVGETRKYKAGTKKVLLIENNNMCPICGRPCNISSENLTDENYERIDFEIAHIYGLKNSKGLKYPAMYHINSVDEINSYKNLLLLCHSCHFNYDNPPSYKKYKEMLRIKSNLNKSFQAEELIRLELMTLRDNVKGLMNLQTLNYDTNFSPPTKYIEKLRRNHLSVMKQKNLKSNLIDYNVEIKNFFENEEPEIGKLILKANGSIYIKLNNLGIDKEKIIDILIIENSKVINLSSELQTALVNYCIFVCEVLER